MREKLVTIDWKEQGENKQDMKHSFIFCQPRGLALELAKTFCLVSINVFFEGKLPIGAWGELCCAEQCILTIFSFYLFRSLERGQNPNS